MADPNETTLAGLGDPDESGAMRREPTLPRNDPVRDPIQDPDDAPPATAVAQTPARGIRRDNWVKIILEDTDEIAPSGQPFGVNGRTYMLKPGVEASVPPELISVLNDAVITVPIREANTMRVIGWRNRLRFPYHRT